jgi:two-component system, sensor histidine kinase
MTTAVVTGNAAIGPSSSSFVAVAAVAGNDDPELTPSGPAERRALARRLHDAAVAAVIESRHLLSAAVALSVIVLLGGGWFLGAIVSTAWTLASLAAAACCGAALLLARRDPRRLNDTRRAHRRLALLGALAFVILAVSPWAVRSGSAPVAAYLLALVLTTTALIGACCFAPLKAMAVAAAALPLSPLIRNLFESRSTPLALAVACGFASAMAALVATFRHRAWLAAAHAGIEQEDRIRDLEHARDAAIKADQEKSRFLAIASHDLRQPVHAIGLFAATLERRLEGSAEEPLVRNLSRAIDGLDRSFNVMLDISRLDAGAIEPRVQQFPLRDLFRRLHMHFAGQAEQKGLGLRFSPGGKSISSDPQLLERVLGNLVQNAIKYTEHGGIAVVARSTPTHIHVEVWDTGIGIRASDLRKVFDEFYQVGRGERVRAQGLGMGLAIVKRLVRLLGHELTVSSRPGQGTMFRVRIALGGLPEIQDVTAPADTLPMPLLQPRTVLVLDDEEPIRDGLCMLLQEWGYEAIAAASIDEAERAVALLETPPDLILSDLHLGDGPDGIAAIETIRRQCGCDVAAMLITGDTSHAEIRRATESGHPVLFKPVQARKLYDALRGLGS